MAAISRRNFIKSASGTGVAFWLGISLAKGETVKALNTVELHTITPFIEIDSTGLITIYNPKPEMGQGTFQAIPALICEELNISLDQVKIVTTNGETKFGFTQWAGGSASVRMSYDQLRTVGAAAREMLIKAASTKWGVDEASCYTENGKVIHRSSSRSFTFGELAEDASKLETPKKPKLKEASAFKLIGKSIPRPDVPLKVSGKAPFSIDFQLPEMVYATVERCPIVGGTLKNFDASETLKVAGVLKVVETERIVGIYKFKGVAVIAKTYWAAVNGRKALKVNWDTKGYESFSIKAYEEKLRSLKGEAGLIDKNIGNVESVNVSDKHSVESFYETPMIAHHTMEPLCCVAHVKGDSLELWTSTQLQGAITSAFPDGLPKQTGFAPEKVKLNMAFLGGSFGRKLYADYIIEAVNVAKQFDKPVKVLWSREDTTQYDTFRPMTFSWLKGGLSEDGKVLSLQHKVISPSHHESTNAGYDKTKVDESMVEGIGGQAYEIPNLKTTHVRVDSHIPLGAWRSVTSSTVAFAHECFIDELAIKAGKDPLDFRLSMLTKDSGTKKILLKLKELSNWTTPLPKNKGRGIAQWEFFAGHCGQVVEVSRQKNGSVKVDKVIAVIDLGKVVNPDNVKNQIEGAIVMALGAATKPSITIEEGKVVQSNFHDTPVPRINETPKVEVHIIADGGTMRGVGEPGIPPFAPALANAIFAATGKRIRTMPFDLDNL